MKFTNQLKVLLTSLLALVIVGCGDDDPDAGSSSQNAPATMAGSTISFNPTVEFTDGTNFVYTNDESGSSFPLGTINGTYTYTTTGATTASIVLTATDIGGTGVDTITIELSNFSGTASEISTFDLTVDGETFVAEVTSGTLAPGSGSASGGSSGGGSSSEEGEIPDDANATPATINPVFVGTRDLTFKPAFGEPVDPASPYADGDVVTFEITAKGELIFEGRTLTNPFFYNGNEYEAIWFDGTFSYAVSGLDAFNELNFAKGYNYFDSSTFKFIGQFRE